MLAQRCIVTLVDRGRVYSYFVRKAEHRRLTWADVRFAIVDRNLIRHQWILGVDSKNRTVRNDTVLAIVGTGCGDHNHLALGFGQATVTEHQCIVVIEKRPEFGWPMGKRQKHIGHKT